MQQKNYQRNTKFIMESNKNIEKVFIWTGNVDWFAAVALSVGMVFGTWVAVKMAIEKGEKLVRLVLAISLLIIAGKLFLI